MNEILIEYAKQEYVKSFCSAIDTVARERKYLASVEGFPLESTKEFVKMIIEKNFAQYYALHKDKVVGWCDIIPKNYEGMRHVGVLGMGLLPDYRKQGLGSMLIKESLDHASSKNGIEKVELEVFASNIGAIRLYEKFGFEMEGRRVNARKIDGITDDIILMGITL